MKLQKQQISEKDGFGFVRLMAEQPEDLWHAYHLVGVGDRVKATTLRKVVKSSSTGSTTSSKVKLILTIEVKNITFDAEACTLHLAGINRQENPHVKLGAYHTLHIELQRAWTLEKDCWDTVVRDRLEEACDPVRTAETAVVVMETGLAHVCLISGHMTITRAKIETSIPKKRAGQSSHDKAIRRFYNGVYEAVSKQIDFNLVKCVLVGSPGFVAADFVRFMNEMAVRNNDRVLIENRSKFVCCKASCGHKKAIAEMLAAPGIASQLLETKAVEDVRAFEAFSKMLNDDPDRAQYSYPFVQRADELLAVDTLMVTDTLFKSCDVATRQRYVRLTESVKEHGGKVRIFSSLHVSGEQLAMVGGIAAILRFPVPEEEMPTPPEIRDESDSDEDDFDGSIFSSEATEGEMSGGNYGENVNVVSAAVKSSPEE